jgi:outer membrane lipoprotein-sorting protein
MMETKYILSQTFSKEGENNMKKKLTVYFLIFAFISTAFQGFSQSGSLTAAQIVDKMDQVINGPADQDFTVKLILIDKNGGTKERVMSMKQKGSDKRYVKFLSPADQRGIAFLSLPGEIMYIYLPSYAKVRRIASHVKNTSFAGTDFTYEDMEAVKFSQKYNSQLLREENSSYVVQLTPKPGIQSDYSKLVMWIRKDIFFPVKVEMYDRGGKLYKVMTRSGIEKVNGYWVSKESEMKNVKAGKSSKMIMQDIKFNSGLSDSIFTKQYLSR